MDRALGVTWYIWNVHSMWVIKAWELTQSMGHQYCIVELQDWDYVIC